jgi:hypothetical protein
MTEENVEGRNRGGIAIMSKCYRIGLDVKGEMKLGKGRRMG